MLKYEMKKVWQKRSNRFLMAVVIILSVVFSIFAIYSLRFVDKDGEEHSGILAVRALVSDKNNWRGDVTADLISDIVEKYKSGEVQSTYDIVYSVSEMLTGEKGDDYEAVITTDSKNIKTIYQIYHDNLNKNCKIYGNTKEQEKFLNKKYQEIDTPFYYEAADSWDTMYLYATTFSLVLVVIIGFMTAGIFDEEFRYHADSVFFSTKYGRSKAVCGKIAAGLFTATLIYGIGITLLSIISFSVMGTSGAFTAYQFYQPFSIYSVTCAGMYGIIILCGYVASLLSASVTMFFTSKMRSMNVAVCIPFLLFVVSPFIGRALPFQTFFSLTPDQLTNIMNCARIAYIYQIGGVVFRQIPFIIIFYTVISLSLLPFIYRNYHKKILK